jgi:cytochrome c-type biogenesis protein CcmE
MAMKRKHKRLAILAGCLLVLAGAAALVLSAISDSLVFFYSPSELQAKALPPGQLVRIGGLVEEGSVARSDDGSSVRFRVTDLQEELPVAFDGLLPDLFREGQGVVVQGRLGADGVFQASEVLAKHDENYMPPEVAEALKKSGEWRGPPTQ